MKLDLNLMLLSLVTSGIGGVLFVYGRKEGRPPHLIAGLVMIAYPFLVDTVITTIVIAIAIIVALWIAVRQGW
jgi:multisubunit Na+/H+ antiporter MnhC subunit